jgi:pimeloyl-ACP methyl ester carboxylesterase
MALNVEVDWTCHLRGDQTCEQFELVLEPSDRNQSVYFATANTRARKLYLHVADLYKVSSGTSNIEPVADVVFVHGLGGDGHTTWESSDSSFKLPKWIAETFTDCAVWGLRYQSHWFFRNRGMPYQKHAKAMLERLSCERIGQRRLVFICHSLGGIIVKQALRAAEISKRYKPIYSATRAVAFIATPHAGAVSAALLDRLGIGSTETRQLALRPPRFRTCQNGFVRLQFGSGSMSTPTVNRGHITDTSSSLVTPPILTSKMSKSHLFPKITSVSPNQQVLTASSAYPFVASSRSAVLVIFNRGRRNQQKWNIAALHTAFRRFHQ